MAAVSYRLLRLSSGDPSAGIDYFKSFSPSMAGEFTGDSAEAYLFPTFPDFVHAATVLWLSQGPLELTYEPVYVIA